MGPILERSFFLPCGRLVACSAFVMAEAIAEDQVAVTVVSCAVDLNYFVHSPKAERPDCSAKTPVDGFLWWLKKCVDGQAGWEPHRWWDQMAYEGSYLLNV